MELDDGIPILLKFFLRTSLLPWIYDFLVALKERKFLNNNYVISFFRPSPNNTTSVILVLT
jgi:hypothetical protein